VHSEPGAGTRISIRIPLTLAIMPALVVTAGGDRFAIPQVGVLELMRCSEILTGFQMMGDAAVLRLRGEVLPLVRLDAALRIRRQPGEGRDDTAVGNVVILEVEDRKFGLLVDEVIDTQEIVVKPLDPRLRALSMFAGATIMGDGCVVLILDVTGLALHAGVRSELRHGSNGMRTAAESAGDEATETLLAVTGDNDAPMAIPLSQVVRVEEFASSAIERLGDRNVVQYRRQMLPLVYVSDLLSGHTSERPARSAASATTVKTVVYSTGGARVGLVVGRILDTIEHPLSARIAGGRKGVLASAVIHGRATEILDLEALCEGLAPGRARPTSLLQGLAG
jgi:two-component system chemotaxis sensor kinase CheA